MNAVLKRIVVFLLLTALLLTLPLNLAMAEDTGKSDLEKALDSWTYAHYTILTLSNDNSSDEENELFFRQYGLVPLTGYGNFGAGKYGYTTQKDHMQVVFITNSNAVTEIQLLMNRDLGVDDDKKYYIYEMFRRQIIGLLGLWALSSMEDYKESVDILNGEAFGRIWAKAMVTNHDMNEGPLSLGKLARVTSFYLTSSKTIGMSLEFLSPVEQSFINIYASLLVLTFSDDK